MKTKLISQKFFLATLLTTAALIACNSHTAQASPFATSLVSYSADLTADDIYNDPTAVLGKPATSYVDPWGDWNGAYPAGSVFKTSIVTPAFNLDDQDNKLTITLTDTSEIIVAFDHDIVDDAANPFGLDFIVYGNAGFITSTWPVTPSSNMEGVIIGDGSLFGAGTVQVSVSPDQAQWYTYTITADDLFPTQAYNWDRANDSWGTEMDWTQPVNPALTNSDFDSLSVADAIDLYNGSAGGMGFDLSESGFPAIRYIKVNGTGDIDAFADVAAVPEPMTLSLMLAAGFLAARKRRRQ